MSLHNSSGTPQKTVKRTYKPNRTTKELWSAIVAIVADPMYSGMVLTTRQIFYQCVVRGNVPENTQEQYNRVQRAVLQTRRQGEIHWSRVRDGARERTTWQTYGGLSEAISSWSQSYRRDVMRQQPIHVELWVEKDSLIAPLRQLGAEYGIPCAALRGYSSDGFQYAAAEEWREYGKPTVVVYAGDLDPSGRDIAENLEANLQYFYDRVTVEHIGLHPRQVRSMSLPASFEAKQTDSRAATFTRRYGAQCTELDAVPPNILRQWYEDAIRRLVDTRQIEWEREQEQRELTQLAGMIERGLQGGQS